MRLRGTTGSALEEIGEDTEGLVEDFSKLNNKIKELTKTASNPQGVSIIDQQTKGYKSTYKILLEISKVWKDIGDMQKAEILETVAGKTRATAAAAILENPELLQKAYADASKNAPGAGTKAIEASLDSIEKKSNIIVNNFSHFSQELFQSDGIKNLLDSVIKFTQNLDASKFQPIIRAIEGIVSLVSDFISVIPPEGIIGAIFGAKMIKSDGVIFKFLDNVFRAKDATEALNDDLFDTNKIMDETTETVGETTTALENQTTATKATTVATGLLKAALGALISVGVSFLITKLSELAHAEENTREATMNSIEASENRRQEFEKQQDVIENVIQKYKEYTDKIKEAGGNETEVFKIRENLAELQNTLNDAYGNTVKQLDLVNGRYETQLELLKLIGEQNVEEYLRNNLGQYNENKSLASKKYNFELSDLVQGWYDEYGKDSDAIGLQNMFAEAGFNVHTTDITGTELYDIVQEVFSYFEDHRDSKNYKYFREFTKYWSDYLKKENTDYAIASAATKEMEAYEKVAVLSSDYNDQYKKNQEILTKQRELLAEGKYQEASLKGMLTPDLSDATDVVKSAFENQKKEYYALMGQIYSEWDDYKEEIHQATISTLKEYNNTPSFASDVLEQFVEKFNITTREEYANLIKAVTIAEEEKTTSLDRLLEIYQQVLKEEEKAVNQIESYSYSDWLKGSSSLLSDADKKEYFKNNELIESYTSATSPYKDILKKFEQGAEEVNFGDLATKLDTDEFFSKLGMESFQSYIYGFEADSEALKDLGEEEAQQYMEGFGETSEALGKYLKDVLRKVLGNMDLSLLDGDSYSLFSDALFGINSELFSVSENVLKIEDSYWELKNLQKQIADGASYNQEEALALMTKYEGLASGVAEKYEEVDEASGKVITKYKFHQSAIDSLVESYATMSNEAISSMSNMGLYAEETIKFLQQMEVEILQMTLDMMNFSTGADTLIKLYNRRDSSLHDAISGLSEEDQKKINTIFDKTARRINAIQIGSKLDLKENKDSDTSGSGTNTKGDKDNSSQFDWLDSYLDKRARAIQVLEQQNETLANFDPIVRQLEEYSKGGTVNLKLRPEIDAEELNKQGWEAGEGFATVFSSTFSNEAGDLAINFTPIIVDPKTGEYKGVLTPDELTDYAMGVIEGTREDDLNLQIGAEFTGKNAIKQAEKAAIKIHKLHEQLHEGYDIEEEYYKSLNNNLKQTNKAIEEEIKALGKAQKERQKRMSEGLLYDNAVKAFGSEAEAKKVIAQVKKQYEAEGRYDLKEYTSEQQSALSAIMDVYTKYLDDTNKIAEDKSKIAENNLKIYQNKIEEITQAYDHILKEFEMRETQLNHYQTMLTNQGMMENEKYYLALIDNETRSLQANISEREKLTQTLSKLNTSTKAGVDQWYETKDAIDECTRSIWESQEAIESYRMSMVKLTWDLDDRIMEIKKSITDETNFLIDTLSALDTDMYQYTRDFLGNDAEKTKIYSGQMSDAGLSTLALRRTNLEAYTELLEEYNKQVEQAEKDYMENPASVEYLDRLNTLKDARNDMISSINQEREAIVSLIKDGYDKQLESLDALTSKYMEAKNAEKDLYDYQKSIAKQTKNIANIRKQMAAYANDTSEEARSKLQQLQVSLEEAEESLADEQYQRELSDQQAIFDHLYQSLEDYFNDKLEDQAALVDDTKQLVNDNLPNIKKTLTDTLSYYKTGLSESISNAIDSGIINVTDNISNLDGDIQAISNSVTNQITELENYLKENDISVLNKDLIYKRIEGLYKDGGGGFLDVEFKSFKDLLSQIDSDIKGLDFEKVQDLGETVGDAIVSATSITSEAILAVAEKQKQKEMYSKPLAIGGTVKVGHYASGNKRVNSNMIAWTQENGLEAIIRPTDNAILTPLKAGDAVLPAKATENIWNMATDPSKFLRENMPDIIGGGTNAVFNNTMSPTIILPNVNNANQFMSELQKNKQFEQMIQDMTIKQLSGGSSLAKLKYKF